MWKLQVIFLMDDSVELAYSDLSQLSITSNGLSIKEQTIKNLKVSINKNVLSVSLNNSNANITINKNVLSTSLKCIIK